MKRRSILCLAGLMAAVIFAGCRREKTQVYEVPREAPSAPVATPQPQAAPQSADQASMPQATTPAVPPLNFQIPANWRQNQATGMRMASFTASGTNGQTADVSVIPLPLMGHETALVNMWRQQVGLPEIGDAEAAAAAQPVTVGGEPGKLFEFTGGQPLDGKARSRILVAMASHDSMSWFFKMTGDASFVGTQKDAFLQFLKSVSFPTQSSAPSQEAAIEAQPALPAAETPNPPPSSTPDWTVPAGWTKVPPAEFLAAEFSIAGNNGAAADVNAAVLDGSGGGVLPNI
ncbi:MAG: hypothetical protein KGR98_04550, partial [Verrucomicrobia bacterium]|nr:hypothetical protein [Verrucomicrobiota bacterium]